MSVINTEYYIDGKSLSYEVKENGYSIYLEGESWIEQLDENATPMEPSKSYEENALLQIESLLKTSPSYTDSRIAQLEVENAELSATLDSILTEIIPSLMV